MTGHDKLTRLALAARRGDRDALAEWVAATQADVWRLCAHLIDRQAADDLTQETYLRAFPALKGFRGDAPVRSWLLTIARRVCAQEIDRRSRGRRLSASLKADLERRSAGAWPDHSHQVELGLLLDELDGDQRIALVLTQLLGCSYAEAAEVCEVPIGTIRSRVARARDALVIAAGAADRRRSPGG